MRHHLPTTAQCVHCVQYWANASVACVLMWALAGYFVGALGARAWQVVASPRKGSSTTALSWRRAECSAGGGAHELTVKAADADQPVNVQELVYNDFVFVSSLGYRGLRRACPPAMSRRSPASPRRLQQAGNYISSKTIIQT